MKPKRPTAKRGSDDRRRTSRQPVRGTRRRSPEAPPRRGRPRTASETAPITRPQIKPVRPKNASQAKARAKARKAKAPKVVRPPVRENDSSPEFRPSTSTHARWRPKSRSWCWSSARSGWGWVSRCGCRPTAAERSYQLGNARETNQALLQQKEALERDVLEAQAAPALAESARELGMIPSRDSAHLVQDPAGNWIVVGNPNPRKVFRRRR